MRVVTRSRSSVRPASRRGLWLLPTLFAGACIPEGPATPPAPVVAPAPSPVADATSVLTERFTDTYDRTTIGPDYNVLSSAWTIREGKLCGQGARNQPVWLKRKLPVNARIEFDAVALSTEGDIKVEAWGDGKSGASGSTYSDATSYLVIFGGWKNSKHVLARLDEHGSDRQSIDVEPGNDDERARRVELGQPYHFVVERRSGTTVRWGVNGTVYFELVDEAPLTGPGHENFGFNDWDAPVCFDNLTVTPL
jgi:hypothetical protein